MAAKNPDPALKGPEDNKGDDKVTPPETPPELTAGEKAAYAAGQKAATEEAQELAAAEAEKVAEAAAKKEAKAAGKRFIEFEYDDPFIKGATRAYHPDGIPNPFTLFKSDRDAIEILANYIVRAKGGCRPDLAKLAEAALQKASAI